jgi:transcription-repair coupling factor (superfamily II helicase)
LLNNTPGDGSLPHALPLERLIDTLKRPDNLPSKLQIIGASDVAGQLLSLVVGTRWNKVVLIAPSHRDVSSILNLLELNLSTLSAVNVSASHLPHLSLWGADRFINPTLSRKQRLNALFKLNETSSKSIIVTTIAGLFQSTLTQQLLHAFTYNVTTNEETDQDELIKNLEKAGYHSSTLVDEEGLFSVRGSIIDVFPPNLPAPLRIEFSGDLITSLRMFSIDDQKSRETLTTAHIGPANEILVSDTDRSAAAQRLHEFLLGLDQVPTPDKDGFRGAFLTGSRPAGWDLLAPVLRAQSTSAFNILTGDSCLVFVKGLDAALGAYDDLLKSFIEAHKRDVEAKRISVTPEQHFPERTAIRDWIAKAQSQVIELGNPVIKQDYTQLSLTNLGGFEAVSPALSGSSRFDAWIMALTNLIQLDHGRVCVLASGHEQEERLASLFSHRDLRTSRKQKSLLDAIYNGAHENVHILSGHLSSWLWLEQTKTLILPEHILLGVVQKRQKSASTKLKNFLSSFRDLKVGDFVVHVLHGVGRYKGMTTLHVGGITGDFLNLEYAGTDKIYLPVDKLNLLQRYSSGGEGSGHPSLDKLGSGSWDKKKQRVKESVKEMADKLLKIQAQRALAHIHTYDPPGDDYYKFEAEFPYEETEDQVKAISEVNTDLQSTKAMDRLICGDVGFGKTEVALRATFRVASEGFQVLVLVPTTILCYQHYRTFHDRLNRHGIRVAQINRFVSSKEQKQVLDDLMVGKVDVLVGTHRLLSQDVKTRRLGLVIVDEEQRFGVLHKEKLKDLRAGADILTLTATPIPRTLHMSMLGLRDISIITTPPQNRMSVKTYVARADESLIRDSITHELDRGGQVFFLHNRVEDIDATTLWVKSLVPRANVRFAHGQMRETDLETTIIDFIEHKFDVLVCTTIIESGVDMPNVNTLIVMDADRFGLAQLYQMRGRVGRSSVQAYAYFLTKDPERLTEESRRRLDVLAMHQELGAGFQIASHDLEIRGAGNLLGAEQSGHASEVGLEMYTDLLAEAISEIRGQIPEKTKIDTEIKLPITALIPESYIPEEGIRLQFYKSLFSIERSDELSAIADELNDRFGPAPEETQRLFGVARLKLILSWLGAIQLSMNPSAGWFEIKFGSLKEKQLDRIIKEAQRSPNTYRLSPDYKLYVYWQQAADRGSMDSAPQTQVVKYIIEHLDPLAAGMEPQ